MREFGLGRDARNYYEVMSAAERASVDRSLHRLEMAPSPDEITIFAVPDIPDLFLHDDGTWQIYFRVPDDATVAILSIAHALDLPD